MSKHGEGRCNECDCITEHEADGEWLCEDCSDDLRLADSWYTGRTDEYLDDPRHGQAEEINRARGGVW